MGCTKPVRKKGLVARDQKQAEEWIVVALVVAFRVIERWRQAR